MKRRAHKFFGCLVGFGLILSMRASAQNDTEKGFFVDDPGQQSLPPSTKPKPQAQPTTPSAQSQPTAATPSTTPTLQPVTIGPVPPTSPTAAKTPVLTEPSINYATPGSGESHPNFDWSQHQGETYVTHPLADKGLVEITKDKTYIYTVEETKSDRAITVHIGMYDPANLRNPSDPTGTETFAKNYTANNAIIMIDYEWQLWRMGIGKLGLTGGAGMYAAQGHGHFVNPSVEPAGLVPMETFTLAVVPINVGAIYRMQVWDRQLFVPYGSGGGTLFPFAELRDDGYGPRFGGSIGAWFAAGVAFNLTYFDKLAAINLGREYGISRIYLNLEFRDEINLDPHYDFSGTMLNLGITAEF